MKSFIFPFICSLCSPRLSTVHAHCCLLCRSLFILVFTHRSNRLLAVFGGAFLVFWWLWICRFRCTLRTHRLAWPFCPDFDLKHGPDRNQRRIDTSMRKLFESLTLLFAAMLLFSFVDLGAIEGRKLHQLDEQKPERSGAQCGRRWFADNSSFPLPIRWFFFSSHFLRDSFFYYLMVGKFYIILLLLSARRWFGVCAFFPCICIHCIAFSRRLYRRFDRTL